MSAFTRRILAASLGGAALAMLLSAAGPKDGESLLCPVADAQDKAGGKKTWKYYGSATCNGASCHASSKMMDERPANEYLTWQSKDRHAKAFNSLFNEDSQYWCEELKIADASKDKRCTECHTTEVPKELQGQKYNREDGVSCDGCHGPAEGWFEPHTKEHKYEDMLKLGMWDTRNMYVRADMCAKCHLQIEPELVDVGHPDLSFELIAHSLREPPHWYERQTWDGIRSWSVGQAVSLRECFRKLKRRIDNKKAPYSIEIAAAQTSSYLGVFRHGVAVLGDDATKKLVAEADKLLNARKLDHAKLAEISARAADSMDAMAKKLAAYDGFSKEQCKQIWDKITADKGYLNGIDSFGAEQVTGSMIALYNSWKTGKGPRGKADLDIPEALKGMMVRPTVFKPLELFPADDEGYPVFANKKWRANFDKASALVK